MVRVLLVVVGVIVIVRDVYNIVQDRIFLAGGLISENYTGAGAGVGWFVLCDISPHLRAQNLDL